MKTRILQISDPHLGDVGLLNFNADPWYQFELVLSFAKESAPNYIFITGDICLKDPDPSIYPKVREKLTAIGIPYFVISGNHDDSLALADCFHPNLKQGSELFYKQRIGGRNILFLDTATGRMSNAQWHWLERQLDQAESHLFIVMHHPPVWAGVKHMDNNYAFMEQERFLDLIDRYEQPIHVLCGHYHAERFVQHGHISIHIAPSTQFQIKSDTEKFELESTRTGVQIIDITEDRITTYTQWLS